MNMVDHLVQVARPIRRRRIPAARRRRISAGRLMPRPWECHVVRSPAPWAVLRVPSARPSEWVVPAARLWEWAARVPAAASSAIAVI